MRESFIEWPFGGRDKEKVNEIDGDGERERERETRRERLGERE